MQLYNEKKLREKYLNKMEITRKEMRQLKEQGKDLNDSQMVELSQKLDNLINSYLGINCSV